MGFEFDAVDDVITDLEEIDILREEVLHLTRKLNRASGRGIAQLVKSSAYETYLGDARQLISKISEKMDRLAPITSWNITISGTEEYVEFELLLALLSDNALPSPDTLKVPGYIWISGLGDVIGELRRLMLNKIIQADLDGARVILAKVDDIYSIIAGLEFSKSLVPNLRRKVDIARTLVERCESDFANALVNKRT